MIKGLYTAASGMMLQMAKQDAAANNLANVNVSGYKKDTVVSQAFPHMLISRLENNREESGEKKPHLIGGLGTGACVAGIYTDHSLGNMRKTDNPTDLALGGRGYFVLETPQGERFTRGGEFKISEAGQLLSNHGYPLLDYYDDYIYLEEGFTIDRLGNVIVGGEELTRLKIVDFDNLEQLQKLGNQLLASQENYYEVEQPEVLQGYIEDANVNAVKEMVTLISVVRAYEALQKVVGAEDETLQTAIDRVGSVT